MKELTSISSANSAKPLLLPPKDVMDVMKDRHMAEQAKRELLADWASDARAVPDAPGLRRLDSGALVRIDVLLEALDRLSVGSRPTFDNDDDDPPPGGAAVLLRAAA